MDKDARIAALEAENARLREARDRAYALLWSADRNDYEYNWPPSNEYRARMVLLHSMTHEEQSRAIKTHALTKKKPHE